MTGPAPQTPPGARTSGNLRRDDLNSGPPGAGQMVCAFYDRTTQKCLTQRPNTQAYDSAVQTGIEAAMMGMQIQQDALHRARMMGIGGGPEPDSMPSMTQPVPGVGPSSGHNNVFSGAGPHQTQGAGIVPGNELGQAQFKECVSTKLQGIYTSTGRSASPQETVMAMQTCGGK